ncbi:MAG: polysaccharide deacetylase family protein [Clostridia bacterium]|nr:polysaccharide deacetylase family protein [Clostridia bacterium]
MKRTLSFILIITVIFCSCNRETIKEKSKISASEENTEMNIPLYRMNEIQYGKKSDKSSLLTGLDPLPVIESFTYKSERNNLSTKKISHSYGVAKNNKPHEISVESQKKFDKNSFNALTVDLNTEKNVYLTFDVGYDNGYTEMILDTLKEKNVKAAFFCTVDEMKSNPDAIARMINEGHIVGNHTENHPSMDELTSEEMIKEVLGFDNYIRTNFGYSSPYFRFPKGEYSEKALDVLNSMGYMCVFWSLAYADWDTDNQKGASFAVKTVCDRIHPGAVILLHAVSRDNAYGLGVMIDNIRNYGYNFANPDKYWNNN